jgi:hypothetical protein
MVNDYRMLWVCKAAGASNTPSTAPISALNARIQGGLLRNRFRHRAVSVAAYAPGATGNVAIEDVQYAEGWAV